MTEIMTEITETDNLSTQQEPVASLLEKFNHTFDSLNTTMKTIQQDNEGRKRLADKNSKVFTFMAISIVLIVIALGVHMFYVIYAMQQIMSNMSQDMGEMRKHMQKMTVSMTNMTQDMRTMTVKVSNMSGNMQQVSTELHQMSSNMQQITSNMQDMRQATVLMESSTRNMTRKVNEMSNTVSPVMAGARQFMPFMPWGGNRRYSRR
jgi:uncharacterized protein YoxC